MHETPLTRRRLLQAAGAGALTASPLLDAAVAHAGGTTDPRLDRTIQLFPWNEPRLTTTNNLVVDGRFVLPPLPDDRRSLTHLDVSGVRVLHQWRGKLSPVGDTAQKATVAFGANGLVAVVTGRGFFYVRQLIPDLSRFSGRTFTLSVDIESTATIDCDVYAQARFADGVRVLVVDTREQTLSKGRHRAVLSFPVPVLRAADPETEPDHALELAFRPLVRPGSNAVIKIRDFILTEGRSIYSNNPKDPAKEARKLQAFYETRRAAYATGVNNGRRISNVPFSAPKFRPGDRTRLSFSDLKGTPNRVSTLTADGKVVDHGVTAALASTSNWVNGYAVSVPDRAEVAKIGLDWTYDVRL